MTRIGKLVAAVSVVAAVLWACQEASNPVSPELTLQEVPGAATFSTGSRAAKPEPNTFTVTHTGDLRGAGVFIQGDGKQENLFGNMSLDLSAFHAKDIPCVFEASGAEQIQTKFQQKKEAGMKIFFYVTASTPRGDVLHLLRVFGEPAVEKPAGWLQGSTTLTFNRFRLENGDGPGPANAACTDEGNTHVRVTVSPN